MSTKIASLYAEIGADTSKFEQGIRRTKTALEQQAAVTVKFNADAVRGAQSYIAAEIQRQKAIANSEKAAARLAREQEKAAKAAERAAAKMAKEQERAAKAAERAAAKMAKEQERAAKAAAKAAEIQRKASLSMIPGLETANKKLSEFRQANMGLLTIGTAVAAAVLGIGLALNKTIDKVVEYGDQVQKLKTITGQSAEETSRQIQLADDARISYDKLAIALQFASKKGIDTSINGLARLSEEFKKLGPGAERTKFLIENFGKQGVEMAKILEMDSKAIKEFAANTGQILTEKDLRNIKEYNHALDSMKDRFEATGNTIGKSLMPVKTFLADTVSFYLETFSLMNEENLNFIEAGKKAAKTIYDEKQAFLAAGDAAEDLTGELDDLTTGQETAEESAKRMSAAYTSMLSAMFSMQKSNDSYAKTVEDITKKDEELANKKNQLTLQMWEEQRAGKMTNDENLRYVQQLAEISQEQEENSKKLEQAATDREKESKQRVYDLAQQKLAADGVISTGEYDYLQNLAVTYGLVSREAANMAMSENAKADSLVESFVRVQNPMMTDLQLMEQLYKYNGKTVNFGINYSSNQSSVNTAYNPSILGNLGASGNYGGLSVTRGGGKKKRDSGGYGMAGEPYMIGTGAQPEMFVPSTNGMFVPNADKKLGGNYTVIVYNPKKETAEESVRRELKKLSYMGVAQ